MGSLVKKCLTVLIVLALLPAILQLVLGIFSQMNDQTAGLIVGIAAIWLMYRFGVFRLLINAFVFIIGKTFGFLVSGFNNDARWMPWYQRWSFINTSNKGLVVDGKNRLSEKHSYQNIIVFGGVGTGKTSTLPIPHALTENHASLVLTDVSGELFDKTSGSLQKRGYDIQVFNLIDIGTGGYFNPLEGISTYTQIAQTAKVIISSSTIDRGGDPFWSLGAENILRVLLQSLTNLNEPEHFNLANLKYLVNHFSSGASFDHYMVRATMGDDETFNEYKGLISGNPKTISSMISTAQTALSGLNPDLAKLTSTNTIDFGQLRSRKTALYVLVRQQDIAHHAFLLNLFFTKLCHALQGDLGDSTSGFPVHLLLDEFGQLFIPNFETFASTSRKYNVAFCLLLQSLSQLALRYGKDQAQTIMDSISTELYFQGMPIELASQLSRRLGQKLQDSSETVPGTRDSSGDTIRN